ncbi:MAG: hypothetical protein ACRDRZ_13100 [Pseudonocardiaceae bacterium]
MTAWIVFIAALAFRWLSNRSQWLSGRQFFFVIPAALTAFAGAALAEIILGEWLASLIRWAAGGLGSWIGTPGGVIVSLVTVLLAAIVVIGLLDKQADSMELGALLVLPTFFVAAAGAGISAQGSQLAASWLNLGENGLSALIGG